MTELLTAKDVQALLQIDRSTVYRMANDGRLPALRIGNSWRFEPGVIYSLARGKRAGEEPAVSVEDHSLAQLLPLECVQLIQDGFADALGIMIIITDMEGNPITRPSNECGLFTALHAHPQVWQTCVDHWREMAARPAITPTFTHSSLGLLCASGLIRVGRTLQGMVFMGGLAPQQWPPEEREVEKMAGTLLLSPEIIEPHLEDVHYLDAAQKKKALNQAQHIADIVSHIVNERAALLQQVATPTN